jgi:hypothetical protein
MKVAPHHRWRMIKRKSEASPTETANLLKDAHRYDWVNLTRAEKLVQKTANGGWTCSWFAQFESCLFQVAVKLAARVLCLERKVRQLEKVDGCVKENLSYLKWLGERKNRRDNV